jgi:hypothetical protein
MEGMSKEYGREGGDNDTKPMNEKNNNGMIHK